MARAAKKLPNGGRPTSREELTALERHVAEGAAARPGVYRMLSEEGGVIYVGKSKRVRERLLGYFRCERRDKGARILRETRAIEWAYTPSEFAALREELRLIKLYRPRFNVTSKRDAEHYTFLRLTGGPAPRLAVTRGGASGDGVCYGPFIGPHLVAEAARELSDALGLRDCADSVPIHYCDAPPPVPISLRAPAATMRPQAAADRSLATGPQAAPHRSVAAEPQAAPYPRALRAPDCIRHDVGKCLGPCIAACNEADYQARVAMARAFLEGESSGPIERFRREMEESKRRLAYERAALYRDRIIRLEKLRDQFAKIRFAVEAMSLVYPVPGFRGDDRVYLIRRGTVRAEAAAPRSTVERLSLQGLIDQVFQPREPQRGAVRTHEIEEILLLSSWFRRYPAELERAWAPVTS